MEGFRKGFRSLVTLLLLSLLLLVHLPTGAEAAKKKKKDPQELRACKADLIESDNIAISTMSATMHRTATATPAARLERRGIRSGTFLSGEHRGRISSRAVRCRDADAM